MFVPAKRHEFNELGIFDSSKVGDVFDIDSGLGGTCTLAFNGKSDDGCYKFHQPAREDWPARNFQFTPDEVLHHVSIWLPEEPTFREWRMEFIEMGGKQYCVDKYYGVVWFEDPQGYFRLKKTKWSIAPGKEADVARRKTKIVRKRVHIRPN